MKLLLTGEPHAGKSTLLTSLLQNIDNKQGFITSEVAKDGQRTGFELVSAEGPRALLADIHSSSEKRVSRYGVNVDSLNEFIDKLPEINTDALLYIDEIGQMQLFSDKFQKLAATYIDSGNDFIGTVSKVYNHEFIDELKNNEEIEIIEVTPTKRDQLFIDILARLKQPT